jgi:hypothetical protein
MLWKHGAIRSRATGDYGITIDGGLAKYRGDIGYIRNR